MIITKLLAFNNNTSVTTKKVIISFNTWDLLFMLYLPRIWLLRMIERELFLFNFICPNFSFDYFVYLLIERCFWFIFYFDVKYGFSLSFFLGWALCFWGFLKLYAIFFYFLWDRNKRICVFSPFSQINLNFDSASTEIK